MAASRFHTDGYTSEQFVESAGAIPFKLSTKQICVLHQLRPRNEYLLAKGRRNCNESRRNAALRELREETGYQCRLLPVTLASRAPPEVEADTKIKDVARRYENCTEPFYMQIRRMGADDNVKVIWWYIAAIEEGEDVDKVEGKHYEVEFYGYDEVLEKLTFQSDRDMVRKAVECVRATYG